MPRPLVLAAAQLGPIQRAEGRDVAVGRMLRLLERAASRGAEVVVFPELALTTFFPRWFHEDIAEADLWFETAIPNPAVQPLFDAARKHGIAFHLGFAEKTPDGRRFNTAILVHGSGEIVAQATTWDDELIIADADLDACNLGRTTIFDFARHRRIEAYPRIATQTGSTPPPDWRPA